MNERSAFLFSGVGFATRQVGNRTKPNLVLCVDDQGLICMKSQSTFKTTEIKFKLNESFEEITADDRKTTVCYGIGGIFAVVWSCLSYMKLTGSSFSFSADCCDYWERQTYAETDLGWQRVDDREGGDRWEISSCKDALLFMKNTL